MKGYEKYWTRPPLEELEQGRGSGRTYKMLQRALATALEGKTVYVLAYDVGHCRLLMHHLQGLAEFKKLFNVHVSMHSQDIQLPAGQLRFRTTQAPDWQWETGTIRGFPAGIPVFIDHDAWDRELRSHKQEKKDGK